ncbi:class I SAM-dependent methyltransferase [Bacillus pinisoli]|uniref:class I SAM-dependent methyltransferase n=1 Tax=Bacillus pinisoli TaxID=2901866 RepID=UPI001FF53F75|nr:class I SAM-dependent methyltransferase [Bacillus pinisoli]
MNHLENFAEYHNPTLYDLENNSYLQDVKFLLEYASKVNGKIIDLACGTGRATIPLAKGGYQMIGVDLHSGMLNEAKNKSESLDLQIEWIQQDCLKLNLNVKSNLIFCVGNSFQHFMTNEEQDQFLTSVNNHLNYDGTFIFGTRYPTIEEQFCSSEEEYWKTYTDSEKQHVIDVYLTSTYDSLHQIQHNTTIRRIKNERKELIGELKTNIKLRYVFPKEMERLLLKNGFVVENAYKDWDGSPLDKDSKQMIYVCRKR